MMEISIRKYSIKKVVRLILPAIIVCCFLTMGASFASSLKKDEEVVLFKTSAYLDEGGSVWVIPVRGWIYEPEDDSIWRRELIKDLLENLELHPRSVSNEIFRKRAKMFLVDSERGKSLSVEIAGRKFPMEKSGPDGHFFTEVRIDRLMSGEKSGQSWLSFTVFLEKNDERHYQGMIHLLGSDGISVISDIDDTIKVSDVTDKRELLANTFLREFRAVNGMAGLYSRWASAGAAFHYVSASPWQLYPSLSEFIDKDGFPSGDLYLRPFRIKDRTFFSFFRSSEKYKIQTIENILRLYPKRRFVLIGDSGERDPEVYGELTRRYPQQIKHVFIRQIPKTTVDNERFKTAFTGLPENTWAVFRDPEELKKYSVSIE